MGRAGSGVPMDLSKPDVFCLSSTRHRKVVQNPQATERERSRTKHCWGLGGAGSVPPSKSGPELLLCILLWEARRPNLAGAFALPAANFAGLIRRTPPLTFSDTAVTERHSDTTIFQLRAHWARISWSIGSGKIIRTRAACYLLLCTYEKCYLLLLLL